MDRHYLKEVITVAEQAREFSIDWNSLFNKVPLLFIVLVQVWHWEIKSPFLTLQKDNGFEIKSKSRFNNTVFYKVENPTGTFWEFLEMNISREKKW